MKIPKIIIYIGLAFLVLAQIIVMLYVVANLTNWRIAYLNPPDQEHTRTFPITTYPVSNISGFTQEMNGIILYDFRLQWNGTLVEGEPIQLSATGTCFPSFANELDNVVVYFRGASGYVAGYKNYNYAGTGSIILYPTTVPPPSPIAVSEGAFLRNTPNIISWQVQGDYYPSIDINFRNTTGITQNYNTDDYRVHVDGITVINQEIANKTSMATGVALVFFPTETVIAIGGYLAKNREKPEKPKPRKRKLVAENSGESQKASNTPNNKSENKEQATADLDNSASIRKQEQKKGKGKAVAAED